MKYIYQYLIIAVALLTLPVSIYSTEYTEDIAEKKDNWNSNNSEYFTTYDFGYGMKDSKGLASIVYHDTLFVFSNHINAIHITQIRNTSLDTSKIVLDTIKTAKKAHQKIDVKVADYYTPSPVVYNDKLYMFAMKGDKLHFFRYRGWDKYWKDMGDVSDPVNDNPGSFDKDKIQNAVVYQDKLCILSKYHLIITKDLNNWHTIPITSFIKHHINTDNDYNMSALVKSYIEENTLKAKLLIGYITKDSDAYCYEGKLMEGYDSISSIPLFYLNDLSSTKITDSKKKTDDKYKYRSIVLTEGTVKGDNNSTGICTQAYLKKESADHFHEGRRILRYQRIEGESWTQSDHNLTSQGNHWADKNLNLSIVNWAIPEDNGDFRQFMLLFFRAHDKLLNHPLNCAWVETDKFIHDASMDSTYIDEENVMYIGYIEGLPPHFTNGIGTYDNVFYNDEKCASISLFGFENSSSTVSETTTIGTSSWSVGGGIGPISASVSHQCEKKHKVANTKTISTAIEFTANGKNQGHYIIQKPENYRVVFKMQDWKGKYLYPNYYLGTINLHFDTKTVELDAPLEPAKPETYFDRIILGTANKFAEADNHSKPLDGDTQVETITLNNVDENSTTNTCGVQIGMGVGNDDKKEGKIWSFNVEGGFSKSTDISTTLDTELQFKAATYLNNPVLESDIAELEYTYYLIQPDEQHNWWVPEGHDISENIWCLTYNVLKIKYNDFSYYTPPETTESMYTAIDENMSESSHSLSCYPNPFTSSTIINYEVGSSNGGTPTRITIYDVMGRQVAVLVNENKAPGNYSVDWDASQFKQGTYICQMLSGNKASVQPLILIK